MEEGQKRIRWSGGECVAGAGEALSLQAGEVVDIGNTPGPSGAYRALWICWSPELLVGSTAPRRSSSPGVARHRALGEELRESFQRAFAGLDDAERVPARIAISRLEEVLLWLAERRYLPTDIRGQNRGGPRPSP